jgi:hypothetical protein
VTAAAELRAAAQRLRALAEAATPGPWHRPLNTRYKSTVTAALPEGERGQWLDGVDPSTGERERCTVVMVNTWSNGTHARGPRAGRDLEFIAAMHPGIALTLAAWLESAAEDAEQIGADPHALVVARAIGGGRP